MITRLEEVIWFAALIWIDGSKDTHKWKRNMRDVSAADWSPAVTVEHLRTLRLFTRRSICVGLLRPLYYMQVRHIEDTKMIHDVNINNAE